MHKCVCTTVSEALSLCALVCIVYTSELSIAHTCVDASGKIVICLGPGSCIVGAHVDMYVVAYCQTQACSSVVTNTVTHMYKHTDKHLENNALHTCISRVSDQNGVSLLYIMLEIHHSGWEPLICAHTHRHRNTV